MIRKTNNRRLPRPEAYMPTPEEIAAMAATIRAEWDMLYPWRWREQPMAVQPIRLHRAHDPITDERD